MIRFSRIFKDYAESGAFNARVGITAAVDDHTFLTKSGDLVQFLTLKGIDYECLDAAQLDYIARRFEAALRTFDEHFRLYQYVIKRDHAKIPSGAYANPVVRQATETRIAFLQEHPENLYTVELYFALVYEGLKSGKASSTLSTLLQNPISGLRQVLSSERRITVLEADLKRGCDLLGDKRMNFVAQFPESLGAKVVDKDQAYRFLRRLLNYTPHKAAGVRLKYDDFVDFQACDSALECHRDHLRLDDYYLQVLTLKEPPAHTYGHMLRGLQELPIQFSGDPPDESKEQARKAQRAALEQGKREEVIQRILDTVSGGKAKFDKIPENVQKVLLRNFPEIEASLRSDVVPEIDRDAVRKITAPTLLLSGEKSLPLWKPFEKELMRLLPEKNRQQVVISGADHMMFRTHAEQCNKAIFEFLKEK